MNIGIDIDDTIANTSEMLLAFAQKYNFEELKREIKLDKEKVLGIHGFRTLTEAFNWTPKEIENYKIRYQDYIGQNANIKPLAKEVIQKLKEEGHSIIIVTSRGIDGDKFSDPYEIAKKILDMHNITYDKLIARCTDKLIVCKENDIEVFIDDRETHCKKVAEGGIYTIMMSGPHNINISDENLDRAYSWVDIYYKIRNYMEKEC